MEKDWFTGDVSSLPLPYILLQIWRDKLTGSLELGIDPPAKLTFKNGDVCVLAEQIESSGYLSRVKPRRTSSSARRTSSSARRDQAQTLHDLLDTGQVTPDDLWQALRALVLGDLTALFDHASALYTFQNTGTWGEDEILFYRMK